MGSEVAALRQQIETECEAMRQFYGVAMVGRHAIISARMRNLGKYHDQLADLVGDAEATKAVTELYNNAMKDATEPKAH